MLVLCQTQLTKLNFTQYSVHVAWLIGFKHHGTANCKQKNELFQTPS